MAKRKGYRWVRRGKAGMRCVNKRGKMVKSSLCKGKRKKSRRRR